MPLLPTPQSKKNYDPVPEGNHVARVYQLIEIGHILIEWEGQEKIQRKVSIGWEFPLETKVFKEENGEQPYVKSREYTYGYSEKGNLLPVVEGIMGRKLTDNEKLLDFDLLKIVGKPCMVNIVHTIKGEKTYANIETVTPLPKGVTCPAPVNPEFVLIYDPFDEEKYNTLPEFIKEKMKSSEEFQQMFGSTESIDISDIPF